MPDDPGVWKQISSYMWAILMLPVAALWRKVDASVTKQELKEAIDACGKNNETLRESIVKLFENAETDRRRCDDRFREGQQMIHSIHVDVLNKLNNQK